MVNESPFCYDQRKFAEIATRSEYRSLFDKSGKQQLEEMKQQQEEFDQRHKHLNNYLDEQQDTVQFNATKIDESYDNVQHYDRTRFVRENYELQAKHFNKSLESNRDMFTGEVAQRMWREDAFRLSAKIDSFRSKTGAKTVWKPERLKVPKMSTIF